MCEAFRSEAVEEDAIRIGAQWHAIGALLRRRVVLLRDADHELRDLRHAASAVHGRCRRQGATHAQRGRLLHLDSEIETITYLKDAARWCYAILRLKTEIEVLDLFVCERFNAKLKPVTTRTITITLQNFAEQLLSAISFILSFFRSTFSRIAPFKSRAPQKTLQRRKY